MNKIQKKILYLYLNPNKIGFNLISFLYQKYKILLTLIGMMLFIYTGYHIITNYSEKISITKKIEKKSQKREQQKNVYGSLKERNNSLQEENNLTFINEKIQSIAQKQHIQINHLQWSLEEEKSIEIKIINNTQSIFNFIYAINQEPFLSFNMLNLTKSEEDRKIELNAILVVHTAKE